MIRSVLLAACCYALVVASALASEFARADMTGVVVGVLDGDTVKILVDKKPIPVRLAEIDAPERAQPFGTKSRQALAGIVFRKVVTVRTGGHDRYGRIIGTVFIDGRNVNRAQVAAGMAWVYRKYLVDQTLLIDEASARKAGAGLWSDPFPVAPWLWRRTPVQ